MKKTLPLLLTISGLLLAGLWIRSHNAGQQEIFIDEAYHITRAATVWDFASHPARDANGKLLLYFWLGIFEAAPPAALLMGRLALALASLLTAALLFRLGSLLHSPGAGLLALLLYLVLPLAFFYERMALADSFAALWMAALAWRSLLFARRPRLRDGAILGLLLALALLAKLTMALLPLLPCWAALLWRQQKHRAWLAAILPPLLLAAGILLLLWLPILLPAALAADSDAPFTLVNAYNLRQLDDSDPAGEASRSLPTLYPYLGAELLLALAISTLLLLYTQPRRALFLLGWGLLLVLLPLFAADTLRTRYLMPLALPIVLLLALGVTTWCWRWGRLALALLLLAWGLRVALPFAYTNVSDPAALPLSQDDWQRYMSGNFSGEALRQGAAWINQQQQPGEPVYSTWGTCQLLYFYLEPPLTCLAESSFTTPEEMAARLAADFAGHSRGFVLMNGDPHPPLDSLRWERVAAFPRQHGPRIVEVWVIRPDAAPTD